MSEEENGIFRFENCVICGEDTDVLPNTPIDCRKNYIDGCGQVCENCAVKLRREQQSLKDIIALEGDRLTFETFKKDKED